MLHQMFSSPSPANEMNGQIWKNGTEKGGNEQQQSIAEEETIVVQEGEERREFILLTRMQPPPPLAPSSPLFFCAPSADLFAFGPSYSESEYPPLFDSFSSSPLFPPFDSKIRPNFSNQNSPIQTEDDGTPKANEKLSLSLGEEMNYCEEGGQNDKLVIEDACEEAKRKWQQQKSPAALPSAESSPSPQTFAGQICPSCNRQFPRLKLDIRRHVSQCQRLKKLSEAANRLNKNSETIVDNNNQINNSNIGKNINCLSPASVDPSNPYQCRWCQFITLYKGNMKRHLVTCHQVSVNLLNRIQFDVERLRKLSAQRPNWDELPIRPRRDGRDDGWTEGEGDGETAGGEDTENGSPNQ